MSDADLRAEVCRVGASLYARGYVHASAGNISVRTDTGYLITPTDACLGTLDAARLADVNAHGEQAGGDRASKTLALHRAIYAADPAARCVIHTHATHLVALTLAGVWSRDDIVPPITPYFVMKVGHVPLIAYCRPGDPAVASAVAQRIHQARERAAPIRAVMLERLGPVVWHHTAAEASAVLEELEETARLWLLVAPRTGRTRPAPRGGSSKVAEPHLLETKPAPLSDAQIHELRTHFGAAW